MFHRCSIRSLLAVTIVFAVFVAGVSHESARRKARIADLERQARQDRVVTLQLVEDVESIIDALGRVPANQAELEKALGRLLPSIHDEGHPVRIEYVRTAEHSYLLQYERPINRDWIYDSTTPEAGWVQRMY